MKLTPGPQSPYSLSIPDQLKMPQYMLLQLFRVCVHAASPFKGASPGQSLLLGTCLSLTLDHCPGLMGRGAWLPVFHSSELEDTHQALHKGKLRLLILWVNPFRPIEFTVPGTFPCTYQLHTSRVFISRETSTNGGKGFWINVSFPRFWWDNGRVSQGEPTLRE